MKEKIKNLFTFIKNAWGASLRGKLGVALFIFAIFIFLRMFFGDINIQTFVINAWHLNNEQKVLDAERNNLAELEHHNKLLEQNSPDYVEEIGLQRLNIGDAKTRILKY